LMPLRSLSLGRGNKIQNLISILNSSHLMILQIYLRARLIYVGLGWQ
jgi:hypothetical protein